MKILQRNGFSPNDIVQILERVGELISVANTSLSTDKLVVSNDHSVELVVT